MSRWEGRTSSWTVAPVGCRVAALVVLAGAAVACPDESETFRVVSVQPADGSTVGSASPVTLTFSENFDPDTCDASTLHLARVGPDGRVFGGAAVDVVATSTSSVRLEHDGLAEGAWRMGVQTGVEGCLSSFGEGVAPFSSAFTVQD